jgi:hypothetical protein
MPILNTINTNTKCYQYRSFFYYATFLRLRRECNIQNLLEQRCNLDHVFSKSDAIWRVSDQFKVLKYLVEGPLLTVLGVLSNITRTLQFQIIRVSLTCQSHLNLTRISSSLSFYFHLSRICFSLSSQSHRILISLSSRAHLTLLSLSTCDSSKVVQDFVHQP